MGLECIVKRAGFESNRSASFAHSVCAGFRLAQDPPANMAETVQPGKLHAAVEQGNLEAVKEILVHATVDDVNHQATNEVYLY